MGGKAGGDRETTTIQDIPPEFKPAFLALYNSAFGAGRTAAGQAGFDPYFYPGTTGAVQPNNLTPLQMFGGQPGAPLGGAGAAFAPQQFGGMQPQLGAGGQFAPGQGQGKPGPDAVRLQPIGPGQPAGGTPGYRPGLDPAPPGGGQAGGQGKPSGPGQFRTGSQQYQPGFGQDQAQFRALQNLSGAAPAALSQYGQGQKVQTGGFQSPGFPAPNQPPAPPAPPPTPAPTPQPQQQPQGQAKPPLNYSSAGGAFQDAQRQQRQGVPKPGAQPPPPQYPDYAAQAQGLAQGTQYPTATGYTPAPGAIGGSGGGIPLSAGDPIIGGAYGGQFLAQPNPLEQESVAAREQVGRSLYGAGNNLYNLGQAQASGAFLNPATNPNLQTAINYALQPAISQFTGSTMPQFASQAIGSGAFRGSSARDLAANQLAGQFGRDILGTAGTIGYQDYAGERLLQQNAGQLIDQAARLNQLNPEILAQAGIGQQEIYQRGLDEQLLRFQEQQQAPFRPLMPLASIIQGGNIGQQYTQFSPQPSRAAQGIAGALGGAGLGASAAGALGQTGWGGAGMTGLGALLGGIGAGF